MLNFKGLKDLLGKDVGLSRSDVVFKPHPRARNYLAKVDREARIVLTVPRGGTQRDALAFANGHREWLLKQQAVVLRALSEAPAGGLKAGDSIWYRGERVELSVEKDWGRPFVAFADQRIFIADEAMDLSVPIAKALKALAKVEFSARVRELAMGRGFVVNRVTVRDQKTRWGSCSTSGTISLSWRLVLAPMATRDYVIFHELAHMKHFDHSARFWSEVESMCPDYREHETWLKARQEELKW